MHIASVRIGKCYSFVPRGQARQMQVFYRPDVMGRIALATPLAYKLLVAKPKLQNELAEARPDNNMLYCGGLEIDYFLGTFKNPRMGLRLSYLSRESADLLFGVGRPTAHFRRSILRENSYYDQAKNELNQISSLNSRRLLFALLGIRHEGVMGISRNACQAILWKLFSLEKYFGIAVETITRVTVIGDQALIDEKTEVGDNYWLRLSTGQLNKWVEERRMATPFFQFYNDCPPSGD